jgi:hypothetical protein
MAAAYKHKRYFRVIREDSTIVTFSDISNAQTLIGFKPVFQTSSPLVTYALEDANQTLVATYEFNSDAEQTAFKSAIDTAWTSECPFVARTTTFRAQVIHFKTTWLHADGSISATTSSISATANL